MNILVVGSSNTDMTAEVPSIPMPGETVLGSNFRVSAGGKGANQAVATARLGAEVVFICSIGKDDLGIKSIDGFKKEGINTDFVFFKNTYSGVALIFVDKNGENSIGVAKGANGLLSLEDIDKADSAFQSSEILLLQMETPVETVIYAAKKAKKYNKKVILNPAPMTFDLPKDLIQNVDILTPNETELAKIIAQFGNIDELFALGIENLVVTLGSKGADIVYKDKMEHVNAFKVNPVDTVGAGDCFNGALACSLSKGDSLKEAVIFAAAAAALATQKKGAQEAIPTFVEVEKFMCKAKN